MKAVALRVQDERLWEEARREAERCGISHAAFVRECLAEELRRAKDAEPQ
jgi:hypothetical protein